MMLSPINKRSSSESHGQLICAAAYLDETPSAAPGWFLTPVGKKLLHAPEHRSVAAKFLAAHIHLAEKKILCVFAVR